jgi:IS4 transposase
MLLLADREYLSYDFWEDCLATGADLVWRVTRSWKLDKRKVLSDGSWLTTILCREGPDKGKERTVRVVHYSVEGSTDTYRLVTSILDPEQAPALELAGVYTQRWEIESAFDEMKTHMRGARSHLRSKLPELVEQEFWGLMIAHRAIRALMHEAALKHNKDPDELSFISALRIVKRTLPSRADFSPSEAPEMEAGNTR